MRGSLKAVASLGALAALIAGCGSSAPKPPSTATLTRAAYVSSAAPGYKMTMTVRESVSAGQITISGNGAFNLVPKREGSMTMQVGVPAAASAGLGSVQLQVLLLPGAIYVKLPPQLASRVPGKKPWLQIQVSQLGKAAGIPGLGQLLNGSSTLNNPAQYVQYLRATSKGTVHDLGQATVDGFRTTHYHATIDLAKLPAAVPASQRPAAQQLAALLRRSGVTQLPIDAWIDSAHLVRRVKQTFNESINGQRLNLAIQVDFLQYGPQPVPTVPPASQTQNLLSLTGGRL
jgi:hypothetical protein